MVQLTLNQSTRQIRTRHCHPLLVSCMEKAMMVSVPLFFISLLPKFFSQHLFQFTCYPVSHAGHIPLVNQENKGLLPPSLARELHEEGSDSEFCSPFIAPHSKLFLMTSFSNLIAIPSAVPLPSFSQSRKKWPPPSLPMSGVENTVMVSFPLLLTFPPSCHFFLTESFSN